MTPTRPKVLTLNGMSLSDFKNHNEALKVADEIVLQNQKEMGQSHAAQEYSNLLLVKVFYIRGEGKKRSWMQMENKIFIAEANVKSRQQLQEARGFIEGLGEGMQGSDSAGSSSVKIENSTFVYMNQQKEALTPPA